MTLIGSYNYSEYSAHMTFYIEDDENGTAPGQAIMGARVGSAQNCANFFDMGYFFYVDAEGNWKVTSNSTTILIQGNVSGNI